jgi:hypothetical protein
MVADPDGIADGSSDPHTIVSIADVAFSTDTAGYVTLVVGVGAPIPSTLTQGSVGAMKGAAPILNANGTYSVTTTSGGYTFLDLRQFSNFDNSQPLQLLLRNTLPDTQPGASPGPFYCSGSAIPFSTAEYTSAGGLMGPYVPRADYPVLGSLPLTPTTSSADLPFGSLLWPDPRAAKHDLQHCPGRLAHQLAVPELRHGHGSLTHDLLCGDAARHVNSVYLRRAGFHLHQHRRAGRADHRDPVSAASRCHCRDGVRVSAADPPLPSPVGHRRIEHPPDRR